MDRRKFVATSLLATSVGGLCAFRNAAGEEPEQRAGSRPNQKYKTDVLICGGGPAGVGAATMAARLGAKVLLVERYGRLGGMAVQAIVGPLLGRVEGPPLAREIVRRIGGTRFDAARLDLQYADIVQDAGVKLLLHAWVTEPMMKDGRVTGVRCASKQGFFDIEAGVVVDATGDGDVAFGAGAEFEQGRPGDGLLQPMTIMYRIAGVDHETGLLCGSEEAAKRVRVPEGTWEEVVLKGRDEGVLPKSVGIIRTYATSRKGERFINATQVNYVDGTNVEDLTSAELDGRRQAYQVLDFLRKHAPGYENAYIDVMPAVIGVRETRRFRGLEYLTREDLIGGRKRPDAVVTGASFPIDIHNPSGVGQAEGLAARVKPYDIPYGCLVPEKVGGLLLAGRLISGSHDAHASYRVQCIAMGTGVAAGGAAAISVARGVAPKDVKVADLQAALTGAI